MWSVSVNSLSFQIRERLKKVDEVQESIRAIKESTQDCLHDLKSQYENDNRVAMQKHRGWSIHLFVCPNDCYQYCIMGGYHHLFG